jgi:hypothetical protein
VILPDNTAAIWLKDEQGLTCPDTDVEYALKEARRYTKDDLRVVTKVERSRPHLFGPEVTLLTFSLVRRNPGSEGMFDYVQFNGTWLSSARPQVSAEVIIAYLYGAATLAKRLEEKKG